MIVMNDGEDQDDNDNQHGDDSSTWYLKSPRYVCGKLFTWAARITPCFPASASNIWAWLGRILILSIGQHKIWALLRKVWGFSVFWIREIYFEKEQFIYLYIYLFFALSNIYLSLHDF